MTDVKVTPPRRWWNEKVAVDRQQWSLFNSATKCRQRNSGRSTAQDRHAGMSTPPPQLTGI